MEKLKVSALTGLLSVLFVICSGVITYLILNSQFESQLEERLNAIKIELKHNITFNLTEDHRKTEKDAASAEITVEGSSCTLITGNCTLNKDSNIYREATILLDSRIEMLESNISKGEIKGDKGDPGIDGAPGIKGRKGSEGDKGPHGQQGFNGIKGNKGTQGMVGETGPKGMKGERGQVGKVGKKGDEGDDGLPGRPGEKGRTGPPGYEGAPGRRGIMGMKGMKGEKGPSGRKGDKGITVSS